MTDLWFAHAVLTLLALDAVVGLLVGLAYWLAYRIDDD